MGAPQQKWTSEEEAALKDGILKHGPGQVEKHNCDEKRLGFSRASKVTLAVKRMKQAPKQDGSPVTDTTAAESDEEAAEARPATTSSGSPEIHGSKRSMIRLSTAH